MSFATFHDSQQDQGVCQRRLWLSAGCEVSRYLIDEMVVA